MSLIERVMTAITTGFAPSVRVPPKEPAPVFVSSLGTTLVPTYKDGFVIAVGRVIKSEIGDTADGLVNDPADPGGLTKWGIAQRSHPSVDIANLTRDAAVAIYYAQYWVQIAADSMPPALAYQALDFAVHSGTGAAAKKLQALVGAPADGIIGPTTLAAIKAAPLAPLVISFLRARLAYMRQTPAWKADTNGFLNRYDNAARLAAIDFS